MTFPPGPFHVAPPVRARSAMGRARGHITAATLLLSALAIAGPAHAEGKPEAKPPAAPAAKGMPALLPNPAEVMAALAHELDKHPDQGVMVLQTITITQGELADVIRSMPVSFASLGPAEISKHALEVMVNQKAMVLNAMKDGLDKDPTVIRRTNALRDRALADAWLSRKGDAAITEPALHALYDRTIAGKPGPTEVRARLILLRNEDEARTVIEKAQSGADFGDLAKTYSKDATAAKGGDLGYATQNAVAPEIGTTMFALAPGQMTPFPMSSPLGYFVLRVEGRQQRGTPTFDQARPQLEAALRAEAIRTTIETVMAHIKLAPVAKPNEPAK